MLLRSFIGKRRSAAAAARKAKMSGGGQTWQDDGSMNPIGCYNDNDKAKSQAPGGAVDGDPLRALPRFFGRKSSPEDCFTAAADYKYVGFQAPYEGTFQCFAGNDLSNATQWGETTCGKNW